MHRWSGEKALRPGAQTGAAEAVALLLGTWCWRMWFDILGGAHREAVGIWKDVHLSLVPQSRLAGSPRQKPLYSDQVLRAKEKQAQLASVWSGSRPMTQEEALLE